MGCFIRGRVKVWWCFEVVVVFEGIVIEGYLLLVFSVRVISFLLKGDLGEGL